MTIPPLLVSPARNLLNRSVSVIVCNFIGTDSASLCRKRGTPRPLWMHGKPGLLANMQDNEWANEAPSTRRIIGGLWSICTCARPSRCAVVQPDCSRKATRRVCCLFSLHADYLTARLRHAWHSIRLKPSHYSLTQPTALPPFSASPSWPGQLLSVVLSSRSRTVQDQSRSGLSRPHPRSKLRLLTQEIQRAS